MYIDRKLLFNIFSYTIFCFLYLFNFSNDNVGTWGMWACSLRFFNFQRYNFCFDYSAVLFLLLIFLLIFCWFKFLTIQIYFFSFVVGQMSMKMYIDQIVTEIHWMLQLCTKTVRHDLKLFSASISKYKINKILFNQRYSKETKLCILFSTALFFMLTFICIWFYNFEINLDLRNFLIPYLVMHITSLITPCTLYKKTYKEQ